MKGEERRCRFSIYSIHNELFRSYSEVENRTFEIRNSQIESRKMNSKQSSEFEKRTRKSKFEQDRSSKLLRDIKKLFEFEITDKNIIHSEIYNFFFLQILTSVS